MTYPQKLLLLHSLVVITGFNGEKIEWIGEGRRKPLAGRCGGGQALVKWTKKKQVILAHVQN